MKRICMLFMAVVIFCCAATGCAGKRTADGSGKSGQAETTDGKTAGKEEKVYTWDGTTFELTEITTDPEGWDVQLAAPTGKWVIGVFQITDGRIEWEKLKKLVLDDGGVRLDEYLPADLSAQGIEIEDDKVYADGTVYVLFDVDKAYDVEKANLYVKEGPSAAAADAAPAETAPDESAADEIGNVDGITVVSGVIGKPGEGTIAYSPVDAAGFFAVDGALVAQSTITISVNPNGVLNYDLSLVTDSEKEINAEIRVFKGGKELASYSETALSLPAGETVINACVKTGEEAPCAGEYTVQFYINGVLIAEDTGTV